VILSENIRDKICAAVSISREDIIKSNTKENNENIQPKKRFPSKSKSRISILYLCLAKREFTKISPFVCRTDDVLCPLLVSFITLKTVNFLKILNNV
jgi:hypothetical protein